MSKIKPDAPLLWKPNTEFINQSQLVDYFAWLDMEYDFRFTSYQEAWEWSVENVEDFWESIWKYFEIKSYTPYTSVLAKRQMPGAEWFTGSSLNYAEHVFRKANTEHPALVFQSERHHMKEISWAELKQQVATMAAYLKGIGLGAGDRVVAYLPNVPEATIAFLASCSLGAVWSSCSPDFGSDSVIDRFAQIEPKVFFAVDGYQYGGKAYDKTEVVQSVCASLPSVEKVIFLPYLDPQAMPEGLPDAIRWDAAMTDSTDELEFTPVPFDHPIWVLYSSGTTGMPKAITHSHGGALLEHLKYLAFHNDVHPGERFFWYSTTGWMMWNFLQASLLLGATAVLYDGSPGFPDMDVLWEFAEKAQINHFGTSAPFLVACMKKGLEPGRQHDLSCLHSIGSTGAPLPPEAFSYVYDCIKKDVWLCSMSGGTDVCTAFVGGCPLEPVYEGEIQARALGCALYALDDEGQELVDEVGEMVIKQPMPSMPIYFWNDEDGSRYRDSYFGHYQGWWRHGDWVRITPSGTLRIFGRSDATLNRQGIRIGTAEIYSSVNKIAEVKDSLIVNLERENGDHYMPLFVVLKEGQSADDELFSKIKQQIRSDYTARHVPDAIIEVKDIPYTISGKKLEAPVKKILMGKPTEKAANKDSMRNPESLAFFEELAEQMKEK